MCLQKLPDCCTNIGMTCISLLSTERVWCTYINLNGIEGSFFGNTCPKYKYIRMSTISALILWNMMESLMKQTFIYVFPSMQYLTVLISRNSDLKCYSQYLLSWLPNWSGGCVTFDSALSIWSMERRMVEWLREHELEWIWKQAVLA
jgi:hypothetical protein